MQVQGHEPDGRAWTEMSSSQDVSMHGVAFPLEHRVIPGQVLLLSLPLPKRFRRYDLVAASYRTYALVRDVSSGAPPRRVGTMLLGRQPPRGYANNPGRLYLFASEFTQRAYPRYELFLNVRLRRLRPVGGGPTEELSVTENLGQGGALVRTYLPVQKGELVEIEEIPPGTLRVTGQVLDVTVGDDRIPRLSMRFVDAGAAPAVREALRRAGVLVGGEAD